MWRYRLIVIFFAIAAAFSASAQADSSMYFREAALIDQLLPAPKFAALFPPTVHSDSSLAVRYDRFRSLAISTTLNSGVRNYRHTYKWDKNGLLEQFSYEAGDKGQTKVSEYSFVYANKSLVKAIRQDEGINDTIWLSWTRSGKPATSCAREGDSLVCDNRLYDGRGRLVVLENAKYGTQRGIFTYTYDDKGRLQTRSFNDSRWGYLICTDSLAYTFADAEKSLVNIKHWLRIAGTGKLTLIDEKTIRADGKTVRYEYHAVHPPQSEYLPSPGGYVDFTYDSLGRPETETYGYAETGPKFHVERRYGEMADSALHYAYTGSKKKLKKELTEKHVTTYSYIPGPNSAGEKNPGDRMIAAKQGYFYQGGKKGKRVARPVYRAEYTWK